ncbi:hypothetical protein OAT67_05925 [Bacteriovoracaceae bacterium]|nr:hypothetical protein [Bacteriovoracaceae bacterium]
MKNLFLTLFILLFSFSIAAKKEKAHQSIILAGGCFWCVEEAYDGKMELSVPSVAILAVKRIMLTIRRYLQELPFTEKL